MIFVVGCPRSGTSLLRDLLRSHPRLTFLPETRF
ncbi:MAG: sulfotransferase, partial [Gemmatimonadota bacterium]